MAATHSGTTWAGWAAGAAVVSVSQNPEATVRKDSDPVEFFLAVLAALQLLGRTFDTVQHYASWCGWRPASRARRSRTTGWATGACWRSWTTWCALHAWPSFYSRGGDDLTVATDETGSTLVTTLVRLVFVLIDALEAALALAGHQPARDGRGARGRRKLPALARPDRGVSDAVARAPAGDADAAAR